MPISVIDSKIALIVIDLQKGIISYPTVHAIETVIENNRKLTDAFRKHGLPVVLVNVTGGAPGRTESSIQRSTPSSDWADLISELNPQACDIKITKQRWGAFIGTDLDEILKKMGITQIVITGVATSIGVESTARSAYEYGYNVLLVTDAMTDMSLETHVNSVTRIFPRLGETGTTQEIITLLDRQSF